jgi:hypothetical protein
MAELDFNVISQLDLKVLRHQLSTRKKAKYVPLQAMGLVTVESRGLCEERERVHKYHKNQADCRVDHTKFATCTDTPSSICSTIN